ncbi:TPA: hypothetical protein HA265_08125, partial [Candidatus Woesearchaeota archaeon]|nr:hypothetical protein [Candidatus Woesearchaeota archaeon]
MDQSNFDLISQAYTKRRSKLILSGKAQRATSHGYWATSNPVHLFELFKKLNLQKHKSFVDLGSGDGIVVAVASLFTKAAGIEVDKELHKDALEMRQKLKLNYTIQNKDYLEEDLSQYD